VLLENEATDTEGDVSSSEYWPASVTSSDGVHRQVLAGVSSQLVQDTTTVPFAWTRSAIITALICDPFDIGCPCASCTPSFSHINGVHMHARCHPTTIQVLLAGVCHVVLQTEKPLLKIAAGGTKLRKHAARKKG
jgi:hypothetical protein